MNIQSATVIANYYQQSNSPTTLSVAQALSAIKLNPRAKFTLQDSAANIENNLTALASIANNLNAVNLSDQSTGFINVTAKQLLTKPMTNLTNISNLQTPISFSSYHKSSIQQIPEYLTIWSVLLE